MLKLLLLKEDNPRSLLYQLLCLQKHVSKLPREQQSDNRLSAEERHLLKVTTQLRLLDLDALSKPGEEGVAYPALDRLLRSVVKSMSNVSNAITDNYFSHTEGPQPL